MHKSLKEICDVWELIQQFKIQQDTQNNNKHVIIIWISCFYDKLRKNHFSTNPLNIKIKNFLDRTYIIRRIFCPYLEPEPFPEQSFPEEAFPEQSSASRVKNLYFSSVFLMLTMLNIVVCPINLYFF